MWPYPVNTAKCSWPVGDRINWVPLQLENTFKRDLLIASFVCHRVPRVHQAYREQMVKREKWWVLFSLFWFELSLKVIPEPSLIPNILHTLGTGRNWWWCRISGAERPAGKHIEQSVVSHSQAPGSHPFAKWRWPKHQQATCQCLTEDKTILLTHFKKNWKVKSHSYRITLLNKYTGRHICRLDYWLL